MQILADSFPSETADDDTTELEQSARKLVLAYPEDLEEELIIELVHFASLIKGLLDGIYMYVQLVENELEQGY